MKGKITYFNLSRAFGFIEDANNNIYYFHLSDIISAINRKEIKKGQLVDFIVQTSKNESKNDLAKKISIIYSEDYKKIHLRNRLTQGIKTNVNLKGSEDEVKISIKFSKYFGISFSREEHFKNARYALNFLQPSEEYKESFNLFNEVLMLYSDFSDFNWRSMDFVDKLLMDYRNRLDPVVIILISRDNNIKEIVQQKLLENETRIIVPFTYSECMSYNFSEEIIQSRLREFFYQRDLFAMESPLKSDSYFYGRSQIVQNLADKYAIGEQSGLFGLRKTGKTSVLFAVERLLNVRGGYSIYLDCQSPSIYNLRWFELLHKIILSISEKYEIDEMNVGAYTETTASENFEKALEAFYKIKQQRVLIILDEIEYISFGLSDNSNWKEGNDYLPFWRTIRSILQTKPYLFSFLIAGVNPKIAEESIVNEMDNPIFNNLTKYYLSLFSQDDVENMVRKIGKYMGLSFDSSVYFKLTNDYGGHPFLIRNACSVLNQRFKTRPYMIQSRDYDDCKKDIASGLIPYIESILIVLQRWYQDEYEILKDIALGNKDKYLSMLRKEQNIINHLLGYGILEKSSNGNYYIKIDVVKDYLTTKHRYAYLPNSQEEYRKLISERRNNIEVNLRKIVRFQMNLAYGGSLNEKLQKILKLENLDNIKSRRSTGDIFDSLYFYEISRIIISEYSNYKHIMDMDIKEFIYITDQINKNRAVDAHAGFITRDEYSALNHFFNKLEDKLAKLQL